MQRNKYWTSHYHPGDIFCQDWELRFNLLLFFNGHIPWEVSLLSLPTVPQSTHVGTTFNSKTPALGKILALTPTMSYRHVKLSFRELGSPLKSPSEHNSCPTFSPRLPQTHCLRAVQGSAARGSQLGCGDRGIWASPCPVPCSSVMVRNLPWLSDPPFWHEDNNVTSKMGVLGKRLWST